MCSIVASVIHKLATRWGNWRSMRLFRRHRLVLSNHSQSKVFTHTIVEFLKCHVNTVTDAKVYRLSCTEKKLIAQKFNRKSINRRQPYNALDLFWVEKIPWVFLGTLVNSSTRFWSRRTRASCASRFFCSSRVLALCLDSSVRISACDCSALITLMDRDK